MDSSQLLRSLPPHVVVGHDGGEGATSAFDLAASLLPSARLTAALVSRSFADWGLSRVLPIVDNGAYDQAVLDAARTRLDRALRAPREHGLEIDSVVVTSATSAWKPLLHVAHDNGADLIVVGRRSHSMATERLGSVAHGLVSHSDVPVLVVTPDAARQPTARAVRVLVAYDGSDAARHAIATAARLLPHATMSLVSVGSWNGAVTDGEAAAGQRAHEVSTDGARVALEFGIVASARHAVSEGDPAESIVELAEATKADIVCVGTRSGAHLGTRLGGVAHAVVSDAPCHVLVVPAPDQKIDNPE